MKHAISAKSRLAASLCIWLATAFLAPAMAAAAPATPVNRLTAVSTVQQETGTLIRINTEQPVGYRYTVYDSFDPVRVVIDFPGLDVSAVPPVVKATGPMVSEVRVSSFDLTSGKLGRVEIHLTGAANYSVSLNDTEFNVLFSGLKGAESTEAAAPAPAPASTTGETPAAEVAPAAPAPAGGETSVVAATPAAVVTPPESAETTAPVDAAPASAVPTVPATRITAVELNGGVANIKLNGALGKYQHFPLKSPARLVVDFYGLKPQFKERTLVADQGFNRVRIGDSGGKTRIVFDAAGKLPKYSVDAQPDGVQVTWGKSAASSSSTTPLPATQQESTAVKPVKAGGPVAIENIEFQVDNSNTLLKITMSGPGAFTEPVAKGTLVNFDVKKASISRSLRRSIDSSAFPSAIKQVTPYLLTEKGRKDVRFAVQLKGATPYSLKRDGNVLLFTVENQAFAEAAAPPIDTLALNPPVAPIAVTSVASPLETAAATSETAAPMTGESQQSLAQVAAESAEMIVDETGSKPHYKGQKISLVFDNADIRNILQLIGEVSEMNIIAGDEVKGNITLRLIDVPWDQALSLVMETKGLGMIQEGNVIRVLPKDKIRAMRQDELKSNKEIKALEETVNEMIQVNYSDLKDISAVVRERLSEQGKISEDNRNKLLIITDIPSRVAEIKQLIARLDKPERQVMIEARIVEANSTFTRDLGVKWGISYSPTGTGAGEVSNASIGLGGSFLIAPPSPGTVLGASGMGSGITFGNIGINSTTLDLRISALETSGQGKIVSTPRITTVNGNEAVISQGTQIPYQSVSDKGTTTQFVDATLELKVTPVINPDNSMILTIQASNSNIGDTVSTGAGSAPSIDKKEAKTKVVIKDGDTTVIGGIYIDTDQSSQQGVPLINRIPLLGHLFKSTNVQKIRRELLIFITPRILD